MKQLFATLLFFLSTQTTYSQGITAILGAFDKEVKLLQDSLKKPQTIQFRGLTFMVGKLNGQEVVVAETGIGKANAAMTTALIIERFEPKQVIFTGIAGAIQEDLEPGDMVIADRTTYHDYFTVRSDLQPSRQTRNPISKESNPTDFQGDTQLLAQAQKAATKVSFLKMCADCASPKVITGLVVTGDQFISSKKKVKQLRQDFNAAATEMEGATVAQVCFQLKVPCIVIRSMSDKADKHARKTMLNFATVAATNSANLVRGMLEEMR
jgi:adenosylhomocysteine nucleosidase